MKPMKKTIHRFLTQLILMAAIIAACSVSLAVANTELTPPIILRAGSILDKHLLKGENYFINPEVMSDGIINTYQLTTEYGKFYVESTEALMQRINELNALKTMEVLKQSGIFEEAMVKGLKAPVKGAVELVKSPIKTTHGFLVGTEKFLSNIGRSIVTSDPHQDNVLKVVMGYDAAKRAYAYEFGIDPYSTFSPVVDRLGEIARTAVAGGLVPKATMAALDHDIFTAMQITASTKNLRKLVRDNSPGDLDKINRNKLETLGIKQTRIDSFLSNYTYNPQEKTLLIGALEQMKGVKGLDVFITAANTAVEYSNALMYKQIARMMAGYHTSVNPVENIVRIDGTLHFETKGNTLVLPAPADYIFKTRLVTAKLNTLDKKIKVLSNMEKKELWITGNMSLSAFDMFETGGWKVVVNSNSLFNKK